MLLPKIFGMIVVNVPWAFWSSETLSDIKMTGQDAITLMMNYDSTWGDRTPGWLARVWMMWQIQKTSFLKLCR